MERRTILVTGGNRGIGEATCRLLHAQGHTVVVTSRRGGDATAAARAIARGGGAPVLAEQLDLADPTAAAACRDRLQRQGLAVDALVNNGAVLAEGSALSAAVADLDRSIAVNLLGAWHCLRAFVPGMLQRGHGRVVNVSSGWGAFAEGLTGPAAYSVTKAALNALTVSLAQALHGDVLVNSCCPGWVRTRMGGAGADLSPDEAAVEVVRLATLPAGGPNGGFFRAGETIAW